MDYRSWVEVGFDRLTCSTSESLGIKVEERKESCSPVN